MLKKFSPIELAILIMTIIVIFYSEYLFIEKQEVERATFIGLWPPTMLLLLIYINSKKQK
jgi:hypothetical protein